MIKHMYVLKRGYKYLRSAYKYCDDVLEAQFFEEKEQAQITLRSYEDHDLRIVPVTITTEEHAADHPHYAKDK